MVGTAAERLVLGALVDVWEARNIESSWGLWDRTYDGGHDAGHLVPSDVEVRRSVEAAVLIAHEVLLEGNVRLLLADCALLHCK